MAIKKDRLCFANYFLLSGDDKTKKLGIFWVNDASFYGCLSESFKFCINLYDNKLVSVITNDRQQQKGILYGYDKQFIPSTVYLDNILYLSEIIDKMPNYLKKIISSKELLDDIDIINISNFVFGNLESLGFVEEQHEESKTYVMHIAGGPCN